MLHHVPLKGIVNMTVQVIPAVIVVLETRDWVMAEDNLTVGVLNLQILRDLDELLEKPPIAAAVMVALNQKYLPVQLVKDRNRFLHITPEHIAKNIDGVARMNGGIPSLDKRSVHFLNRFERAVIECQNVIMAVMPIGDI
jgi:hypothetical protein